MQHLLLRQLAKLGLCENVAPDLAQWRAFLDRVVKTYREADQDRYTLERSLMTSSREMQELYEERMNDRMRAEEALRASEERYRRLFEASPHPAYLFDKKTHEFRAVNDAAVRFYGYSREEFLARKVTDLKPPDEVEAFVQRMLAAADHPPAGPIPVGVKRHVRKDGTVVEVDITSHAVSLAGEELGLAICVDVTEQRRLEGQLRQAQKMEAVGRLAGGIAHDFNNLLAVILGDAELALDALANDHPARADVQEIDAAGRRAALLTQQLLTFSRQQPCRPRVLALNTLVTNLEKMLRRILGEDIEISAALAPSLGSIQADPGQVEQVLVNLAVNARDAMPLGGRLCVRTANVFLDGTQAAEVGVSPGPFVVLSVADTGLGMDAKTVARIFEPFFTTKEVGKGTGLGLSTVFGIVQQAGGGIAVSSKPGKGSTFHVYFPCVDEVGESIQPSVGRSLRGSESVLVVEDEEAVRRVVCRLLTSRGYSVLEADSARSALELLGRVNEGIDLIVTDLVMPDMHGRRMAAQILERYPLVKVLYMSGYTEHATLSGPQLGPLDHLIHKPFTMEEMASAVRRVLEGRRVSSAALSAVRV